MKTNTTHKWLKLLIAASIAISTNGAWAACEDEFRATFTTNNLLVPSESDVRARVKYKLEEMQSEAAKASETDKKKALISNEKNSRDVSLSPSIRAYTAFTACLMRATGITTSGSASTSQSNAQGGAKCEADKTAQARDFDALKPLSQGVTPQLMRTMWMSREAAKVLRNSCPATPANQKQIADYERAYEQAETACNQLSSAKCAPNPYR